VRYALPPLALIALGALLCLYGCGSSPFREPSSLPLVADGRAVPLPPAQLARAATVAERFASAYARSIYRARRPRLPGASRAVELDLAAAATRVPLDRLGLRPHAGEIALEAIAARRVEATVQVRDGTSPPFAVAFAMRLLRGAWVVVSVSSPE